MRCTFNLSNTGNAGTEQTVLLQLSYFVNSETSDYQIESRTFSTTANGRVEFEVAYLQLHQDVFMVVKSPDGQILTQMAVKGSELDGRHGNNGYLIEYAYNRPVELTEAAPVEEEPRSSFVYGRLIETRSGKNLEDVQIVIMVRRPGEETFQPLTTTRTESGGYFFFEYPEGAFAAATALIGLDVTGRSIPIRLNAAADGDDPAGGYFPKRLVLAVELQTEDVKKEDCDCGCSDLNLKDKRVLEEFSFYSLVRTTEPEIRGFVLEEEREISLEDILTHTPSKSTGMVEMIQAWPAFQQPTFTMHFLNPPAGNTSPDTGTNAEETARLFQAIRIRKSVLNNFLKNEKEITPENLPRLVAQNETEKLRAAISPKKPKPLGRVVLSADRPVDWDHEPTLYQAVEIAHGHLLHFKAEWMADGYSLGDLLYSLPLAPGQKKQIVVFDWDRRESASNTQAIEYEEGLSSTLARDRDVLEITRGVVEEHLRGQSSATTSSASAGGGFLGLGGLIGISGGFGHSSSSGSQDARRQTSASDLQKLKDRITQSANAVRSMRSTVIQTVSQGERFEVSSETVANYNHCHALTIQYYEVLRHFKVRQRFAGARECLFVPLLMSPFDLQKALRWREALQGVLVDRRLVRAFDAGDRVLQQWKDSNFPDGSFASGQILNVFGSFKVKFILQRPKDKREEEMVRFDPVQWAWIEALGFGFDASEFYDNFLKNQQKKDEIFHRELGEKIARAFVDSLEVFVAGKDGRSIGKMTFDLTLTSRYRRNQALNVTLRLTPGGAAFSRDQVYYLKIRSKKYDVLPEGSFLILESGFLRYESEFFSGYLFKYQNIGDDLTHEDGATLFTGPTRAELRDPRKDDLAAANKLVDHLNDNLEYYHKAIWLNMTPERRFMLLDGIILPSDSKAPGRSVASLVENQLVGVVGNSLVFPVAPGLNLDPRFSLQESLTEYYMVAPSDPVSISVPTKGVFAEAVLGQCNSCETIDESRFWRWEESPIPDSPTAINPINTDSRRADPGNLQPQQLPTPIVNIQNAPNAPDPTGLASTLALLGKGDTFRDITGLTENQKNALAAYQKSMDTTQAFAEQAANLELAKMMERRFDKAMQEIDKMEGIEPQEKAKMKAQVMNAYLGAGAKEKEEKPAEKTTQQKVDDVKAKTNALREGVDNNIITDKDAKALGKSVFANDLGIPEQEGMTASTLWESMQNLKQQIPGLEEMDLEIQPASVKSKVKVGKPDTEDAFPFPARQDFRPQLKWLRRTKFIDLLDNEYNLRINDPFLHHGPTRNNNTWLPGGEFSLYPTQAIEFQERIDDIIRTINISGVYSLATLPVTIAVAYVSMAKQYFEVIKSQVPTGVNASFVQIPPECFYLGKVPGMLLAWLKYAIETEIQEETDRIERLKHLFDASIEGYSFALGFLPLPVHLDTAIVGVANAFKPDFEGQLNDYTRLLNTFFAFEKEVAKKTASEIFYANAIHDNAKFSGHLESYADHFSAMVLLGKDEELDFVKLVEESYRS